MRCELKPCQYTSSPVRLLGVAVLLTLLSVGCSDDGSSEPSTNMVPSGGAEDAGLYGVWSTSDGEPELCVIFCSNGRFFGGESTVNCADTSGPDFDVYGIFREEDGRLAFYDAEGLTGSTGSYERTDDVLVLTLRHEGLLIAEPTLSRVIADHPLCTATDV